jgi:hypothetical protein
MNDNLSMQQTSRQTATSDGPTDGELRRVDAQSTACVPGFLPLRREGMDFWLALQTGWPKSLMHLYFLTY